MLGAKLAQWWLVDRAVWPGDGATRVIMAAGWRVNGIGNLAWRHGFRAAMSGVGNRNGFQ